jgi:predicted RNase H-like nuclease (RuvC/YqgF family)
MKRVLLALLTITFATSAFAQSIADAARKERARQKTAQSKVVVTGTGNLSGTRAVAVIFGAAIPGAAPQAGTAAVKPIEPTDNKGRNETYWRNAFQQARDGVTRAQARIDVLNLKIKELNTQLLRQSDVYNRENRIGAEINATQKEIDDTRKELDAANKKVADLEDELRKSNGPAGWAR